MKSLLFILFASFAFMFSAASRSAALDDLVLYKSDGASTESAKEVTLVNNGLAAGARLGFYERAIKIRLELNEKSNYLDRTYPFSTLLSGSGYLPPVVEELGRGVTVSDPTKMIEFAQGYRIVSPARFVLGVPSFRDYVFDGLPDVGDYSQEKLTASLLPKTENEKRLWSDSVRKGYALGEQQADDLFKFNMQKMVFEFAGMWRYKRLLDLKMIKAPAVASSKDEVDVSNDTIKLIPRTSEIVDSSKFNRQSSEWKVEAYRE